MSFPVPYPRSRAAMRPTRLAGSGCRFLVGVILTLSLGGGAFSACQGTVSSPGQGLPGTTGGTGGATGVATGGAGRIGVAGGTGGKPGTGSAGGTTGMPHVPAGLDAGRTTLRRLDRIEYNNTVRDLLGTASAPAQTFPADDVSAGFDTIGATLSISPVLTQQLEATATALVDELFARPATDPVRMRLLPCAPTAGAETKCAQKVLNAFLPRAFRRPTTSTEVASYVALVSNAMAAPGAPTTAATDGLKAALAAALLSPHFLLLVEPDSTPGSAASVALTDYQLATRLSYFLWSSMPDDVLTAAAQAGGLAGNPSAIQAQVTRMLADPKAAAFAQHYGAQWLEVHFLDTVIPDPKIFPSYTDALRTSALKETVLFFQQLVSEDLPLQSLVTANFSMLNATLGKQYGVSVSGDNFVKTSLVGTQRVGILTQDSLLMGKSYADRTSPVKRGYFVLSQLLCTPPPPPPPNVPALMTNQAAAGATIRQQLDAHASNPGCAGCHVLMDPLGYALEHFDGIGGYRTLDNGSQIDASGTIFGAKFDGAADMASAVASSPQFVPCMAQQMLTYAVGRSFEIGDAHAYAADLGTKLVAAGHGTWRGLIAAVAISEAFTTRRGEVTP